MSQPKFFTRRKHLRPGQPRIEDQPAALYRDLSWYLVDYLTLGLSGYEIARRHGACPRTVYPALKRAKALLPTIRELIPK